MIEIRRALSEEDRQACLAIRHQVFVEEQGVDEDIDEYDKEAVHFLALFEKRAVGTGRLRPEDEYIKFERVAILEEMRGQGVGRDLVMQMQTFALGHYPDLTPMMHAQVQAVPFYERMGWTAMGEPFDEAGIEHQVMVLVDANLTAK